MKSFTGKTLRWNWNDGVVELALDREPANEIGTAMLAELEKFVGTFDTLAPETSVCIISSARKHGFSAGADLRELYEGTARLPDAERLAGIRQFLERIHAVLNAIDAAPFVTLAAFLLPVKRCDICDIAQPGTALHHGNWGTSFR